MYYGNNPLLLLLLLLFIMIKTHNYYLLWQEMERYHYLNIIKPNTPA